MSDLSVYMKGFDHLLDQEDVVEISLNPSGDVFVERFGKGTICEGQMAAPAAERFLRYCASRSEQGMPPENPCLSARVPGTMHRLEGLLPPVVRAPAFSIRRHAEHVRPLEQFSEDASVCALLEAEIAARRNIVVAGSTSSGKTTLVNSCLMSLGTLCPEARVIALEDTAELQVANRNSSALLAHGAVTLNDLLVRVLRLAPDRIVVGEVRTGAVLMTLLKAWNTGHPGGLTTVHANSAREALSRFSMLAGEVSAADQSGFIASAIDTIVFLHREAGPPSIREILRIHSFDTLETLYHEQ